MGHTSAQLVIRVQISRNILIVGLGLGMLKNKLPNVIWLSMYFSGPSKTKSPGLILRRKPAEIKRNSFDFACSASCGIGLRIGGVNTGVALTLHTPLEPGIFSAFIRRASLPGPTVAPSIEPVVEIWKMVCSLFNLVIVKSLVSLPSGGSSETVSMCLLPASRSTLATVSHIWICPKLAENELALK